MNSGSVALTIVLLAAVPLAQESVPGVLDPRAPLFEAPDVSAVARGGMRDVITRYRTDARTIDRFYDVWLSETRRARRTELAQAWLAGLERLDFDALGIDDRIDFLLFQNKLRYELRRFALDAERWEESRPLLPFADEIVALQETRRLLLPIDPERVAKQLVALEEEVTAALERLRDESAEGARPDAILANRVAGETRGLRSALGDWFDYYDGYDPLFSWWVRQPYGELEQALDAYARHLREEVAGIDEDDQDTILGDPIGRDALRVELEREWIPYAPEELIEIAEAEFAWCDREMARASNELGFGDDWRAAQEHVKTLHVGPGEQPALIRSLAFEAIDFLEERDLLTIPPLAKNSWRMEMMSPERQKVTPYFTGGEVIRVSFPTADMEHADKEMSMRGNNVHFSRATVHHELIPGTVVYCEVIKKLYIANKAFYKEKRKRQSQLVA